MKLTLTFGTGFCCAKVFFINEFPANVTDFGKQFDAEPSKRTQYGCGNRVFKAFPVNENVLEDYEINVSEYNEICDKLTEGLSWGRCSLCA